MLPSCCCWQRQQHQQSALTAPRGTPHSFLHLVPDGSLHCHPSILAAYVEIQMSKPCVPFTPGGCAAHAGSCRQALCGGALQLFTLYFERCYYCSCLTAGCWRAPFSASSFCQPVTQSLNARTACYNYKHRLNTSLIHSSHTSLLIQPSL